MYFIRGVLRLRRAKPALGSINPNHQPGIYGLRNVNTSTRLGWSWCCDTISEVTNHLSDNSPKHCLIATFFRNTPNLLGSGEGKSRSEPLKRNNSTKIDFEFKDT